MILINAKVTCLRCGIEHSIKLDAYKKRIQRKQQNVRNCPDCYERPAQIDTADFWEFVKTALRLSVY